MWFERRNYEIIQKIVKDSINKIESKHEDYVNKIKQIYEERIQTIECTMNEQQEKHIQELIHMNEKHIHELERSNEQHSILQYKLSLLQDTLKEQQDILKQVCFENELGKLQMINSLRIKYLEEDISTMKESIQATLDSLN